MVVEDWEKARDWLKQKSLTRFSAKVSNQNGNAMIDKHIYDKNHKLQITSKYWQPKILAI